MFVEKYKLVRERLDKEDELLNTRTALFLTGNSLLFTASQIQNVSQKPVLIGVATFGLILSTLWLITSKYTTRAINYFHDNRELITPDYLETPSIKSWNIFYPNNIFGWMLPLVIIVGWVLYLIYIIFVVKC